MTKNKTNKIAILGGTFNPIHLGHLHIAEEILKEFCLNKILFVLSANPPHKENHKIISATIRFEMLKLALHEKDKFFASDIEIKRKGKSYTIDTINSLKHSDYELFLILGQDSFLQIQSWKDYKKILQNTKIIVAARDSFFYDDIKDFIKKVDKDIKNEDNFFYSKKIKGIFLSKTKVLKISSSKIRNALEKNLTPNKLPLDVLKYIKENRLYDLKPLHKR